MKCDNCETEIESGLVYCPKCGKPIQLVPNYNVLEEELLSKLVEDKDKEKNKFATGVYKPVIIQETEADSKAESKPQKLSTRKKIIILLAFILLALILVITYSVIYYNKTHTYEYSISKAYEAYSEGDYTSAISYYSDAVRYRESDFESIYGLAKSYYYSKFYSEAAEEFEIARELQPDNTDIYLFLLSCYDATNNEEAIYALYQQAPNDNIKLTISSYIVAPPDFSLEEGEYDSEQTVHITSIDDYAIYYTLDGRDPEVYGELYKKAITLEEGTTELKAVCLSDDGKYSDVISAKYEIIYKNPVKPEVSLAPGTYGFPTFMVVTNLPENCKCYYTFNGSAPGVNSLEYNQGFNLPYGTNTIRIIYIDDEGLCSEEYNGVYISQ